MKVCVFGAGGIGSYLAANLAETGGIEVSAVGRGDHLAAIRRDGVRLVTEATERIVRLDAAEEDPTRLPHQDIVFVTLKAQSLPAVAANIRGLLKPDGHAVFVVNGIPWWWNHGLAAEGGPLPRLDPDGRLWNELGPQRAVGCVVYSANSITAPGTVTHLGNNRWVLGEPDGVASARVARTAAVLSQAGLQAEVSGDLRLHVWKKLLRNAPFNALCALTRLAAHEFDAVPPLADLAQTATDEVIQVARAKGWTLPPTSARDVIDSGGLVNGSPKGSSAAIRPSMLTDVLLGRSLEIEAIIGQVQQFGREARVPTPTLDALYALLAGIDLHNQTSAREGSRPQAATAA